MKQSSFEQDILSASEWQRYARQIILPELGIAGQQKLKQSRVLIIGAGGLGSPVSLYLSAAGVGTICLADFDEIDPSNLHRQILYTEHDVGRLKVEVAAERLRLVNPYIQVLTMSVRLSADNARSIIQDYDLVVDGTDNFNTRYLVNDACVLAGKPYVYASILKFEGLLSVFAAQHGPCYRCLYPETPPAGLAPSCSEGGVLGVLPGIMGTLQALEAVKLLLSLGTPMVGRVLQFDALSMSFREFEIDCDPNCVICSPGNAERSLTDMALVCSMPAPIRPSEAEGLSTVMPEDLSAAMTGQGTLVLIDVRDANERRAASIPGDMHIPLAELESRLDELPKEARIVCYCLSGIRSKKAASILAANDFRFASSLAGGIIAWKSMKNGEVN
jgi:molybdopterin/thiamine biosynthesis adenylyltransferase/rhodanese-related sulfurtransferase